MRLKRNAKRVLSLIFAAAMIITSVPASIAGEQEAKAADPYPALLASFDFDSAAVGGVYNGGNAIGTINGSCPTIDKIDDDKALYLNGQGAYLDITNTDGKSPLAGKNNITVSYDSKISASSKSWPIYAAPDTGAQTYQREHYFGVLHNKGNIRVELYNNSNGRPGNELVIDSGAYDEWNHIDIVITETDYALYINGTRMRYNATAYTLSDILGTSGGILQLGKANWDNGEYYGGMIDNFKIYDGTLDDEQIAEEAAASRAVFDQLDQPLAPIDEAAAQVKIQDADDVRGNLALIKETYNGATVEWISSNRSVITDSAASGSLYDGGIVTRPSAGSQPVAVTLTATITLGSETKTKTFNVKVQPLNADLDRNYTAGYLWSFFNASGGYEKIFYGYSADGLKWEKINKDDNGNPQPLLTNDAEGSDLGVRDPHIIRSAEGDRYWIIGTDLHAEGGGAGGSGWNQQNASKNLVVWESTDLVNWSEPRIVFSNFDNAGCVWAPEAIYDDTTGDYVVYWSMRDKRDNGTNNNAHRVYVCRTRDFATFSKPKIWMSEDPASSTEVNIIDCSIVKDGDKFYRFATSDWNTIVDEGTSLDTEDVLDVRVSEDASAPNGTWTRLVKRNAQSAAGFSRAEGFTVYKLPDGRWCAMGDNGGYKAFMTNDLSSGKFTQSSEVTFPDGAFRHGTVMRLSAQEEARILAAFTKEEPTVDPIDPENAADDPVLEYTFDNDTTTAKVLNDTGKGSDNVYNGSIFGNAKIVYDSTKRSNILELDGSSGGYGEIPRGFFDERDVMTITMDVRSDMGSGNFFTFTYGRNSTVYDFFRVRGSEVRNAITTNAWQNESEVLGTGAGTGNWQNVAIVINGTAMKLYIDGTLVSTNNNTGIKTTDLGRNLYAYLGKSFYDDPYFDGAFDNFRVYNRVLSDDEIAAGVLDTLPLLRKAVIGTVPQYPGSTMGTDDHTAVTSSLAADNTINSYVRRSANLAAIPVTLNLASSGVTVTANGVPFTSGNTLDLTKDVTLKLTLGNRSEEYTLKTPKIATNPVLPGQYADPDIDYFDGKFWIYPTTDGYSGWGGSIFHAWSSTNLADWTDEGVILDVKDKNPGTNAKGIQIASSAWSDGNAWAPTIEKKNGKYYFYYCGNINSSYTGRCGTNKAIGVAVADNPQGPYVANELPIVYPRLLSDAGVSVGQVIDPSIFTDDDGTSYLFFGNGSAAMVKLNDDMVSVDTSTFKKINLTDFRESVVVMKKNGLYHFTWSCDDTGSPNYHVNYGTATSINGNSVNVTYRYTILSKDESGDMLGTAHQSLVTAPDGRVFMAYHRFYTPLGIYTSGLGYHRETCINEVTFNASTGYMNRITPTMEGVIYTSGQPDPVPTATPTATPTENPDPTPTADPDNPIPTTDPGNQDPINPDPAQTETPGGVMPTPPGGTAGTPDPNAGAAGEAKTGDTVEAAGALYTITSDTEVEYMAPKSKAISKVVIPAKVKIGSKYFKVTAIAKKAFAGCKKLKTIQVKTKTLKKVGKQAFKGIKKKAKFFFPRKKFKKYKKLFKKKGQKKARYKKK